MSFRIAIKVGDCKKKVIKSFVITLLIQSLQFISVDNYHRIFNIETLVYELLNYTEEVRNSLFILERWLSKTHDNYDATVLREEYSALLNLATKRLDSLIFEHTTIIENAMKGN